MLSLIHIQNLAIVAQLELELSAGMTVITGETGAGKSIIVDALSLVLGERADSRWIGPQGDSAEISLLLKINEGQAAQSWLNEQALWQGSECWVRRVLNRDGRSRNYINGKPVALQQLRTLATLIIDIHSQHEYHALLNPNQQRLLLDAFAGVEDKVQTVKHCYQAWQTVKRTLLEHEKNVKDHADRLAFLRYQLDELEAVQLQAEEWQQLTRQHKSLTLAEDALARCQQVLSILATHENKTLSSLLTHCVHQLMPFKNTHPHLANAHSLLETALLHVNEAISDLHRFSDQDETDAETRAQLEKRLSLLHDLARKHKIQPEQLPELQQQLQQEWQQLAAGTTHMADLATLCQANEQAYYQQAGRLSLARQQAAQQLMAEVTESLQQLGMRHSEFVIELTQAPASALGLESVLFTVRTNQGQPFQPLHKTASGGELSRLSLAIQVATLNTYATPIVVFDEVDVGIGGATAAIVGKLLKTLSRRTQVLCVTHLPQVAAFADDHLVVEKNTQDNITHSQITRLSKEQQIQEIARMLGGLTITEQTIAHAREMVTLAV